MDCSSLESEAYTVTKETIESLSSCWLGAGKHLGWNCPFVLPPWLAAWRSAFATKSDPALWAVRQGDVFIGIAPLLIKGKKARFLGSPDVCDFLDFVVAPGRGKEFFAVLIDHLRQQGITHLDLKLLRPDSSAMSELVGVARDLGHEVVCEREDVSFELELPATWEDFLDSLAGAQRHEIRRKLRRLHEAAEVRFRTVEGVEEVREEMDVFLALFGSSRRDKAAFMTPRMASFFRSAADKLAGAGILRLSFLELDARPAAAVMCFDLGSRTYLYNNGYDGRFRSLSVGLLSKVLSIQEAIRRGRTGYDLLKGEEVYKRHLGGKPVPLYGCRVRIR